MQNTAGIHDSLAGMRVPLTDLTLLPGNPRRGDVDSVARSYSVFGQRKPIVARRTGVRDGRPVGIVIAGNHQLQAAERLGWSDIAVVWTDDDEMTAKAFALADNRTSELGSADDELLAAMLSEVATDAELLKAASYSESDLLELLNGGGRKDGLNDPDEVPDAPAEPRSQLGDLWLLGEHRLLCGDSKDADGVGRLLGGRSVDMILTDPPYCSGGFQEAGKPSGSIGNASIEVKLANDTLSTRGYLALMKAVLDVVDAGLAYIFTDWRMWVNLFDLVESAGFGVRSMLVWDKGPPGMGVGWRNHHELVMLATRGGVKFDRHGEAVGNVLRQARTGNPLHPTQKPVGLLAQILSVTNMADTVYDPFAGSGSTLIAAHGLGRRARCVELDPRYVDVVCRRFQEHTGEKPVLERTGEPVDFTEVL